MENLNFEKPPQEGQRKQEPNLLPRQEFVEGKIPFKYSFEFSGGETLKAFQDKDGVGHIVIERNDGVVFDAAWLLPKGWKFVTPTYFEKHQREEDLFDYVETSWVVDRERKLILLGEFESPRDFFGLLHEIGHAKNDSKEDVRAERKISKELGIVKKKKSGERTYEIILNEDMAKLLSKVERRAWAWALHQFRKIEKDSKVDLRSLFPAFQDFKTYIDNNLSTYRRNYEWIIKEWHDRDFYKELQKYFDKWRYGRS